MLVKRELLLDVDRKRFIDGGEMRPMAVSLDDFSSDRNATPHIRLAHLLLCVDTEEVCKNVVRQFLAALQPVALRPAPRSRHDAELVSHITGVKVAASRGGVADWELLEQRPS